MNKLKEVLGSQNFLTSVFSLVLLAITANGIELNASPEELSDLFYGKNIGQIGSILLIQFFTPLMKIGRTIVKGDFSFAFTKSANFTTNVLTLVALLLGAFFDEQMVSIIVAFIVQGLNLIIHLMKPAKNPVTE